MGSSVWQVLEVHCVLHLTGDTKENLPGHAWPLVVVTPLRRIVISAPREKGETQYNFYDRSVLFYINLITLFVSFGVNQFSVFF